MSGAELPPLPPCGLYRTTVDLAGVPAGRLVYFHNHGNPGPGIYLPERWHLNRAQFAPGGTALPDARLAFTLEPLPREGLYRVQEPFHCCEQQCRTFEPELLVQLGYDGGGHAILFTPQWTDQGLAIPSVGQRVERDRLPRLTRLRVPEAAPPGGDLGVDPSMVH